MAEPVWGQLAKAQDNDQTIDEAIAAAIATHEADPDAHTGAGESLETHKAQGTVDHPVGSIVADKLSTTELVAECSLETLDNWNTKQHATLENWPGARLVHDEGLDEPGILASEPTTAGDFLDENKNMLIQATLYLYDDTTNTAYIILGDYTNDTTLYGFGFQIINGVVKGFAGGGASPTFTANLSIDATTLHVYRAQYNYTDDNIKFYIDGILKATITGARAKLSMGAKIYFRYSEETQTDSFMQIYNIIVGRQI